MCAIRQVLFCTTKQKEQDSFLDPIMAVDGWRQRLREKLEDFGAFCKLIDLPNIRASQRGLSDSAPRF
jgi:hypothetical protein